jgi:dephospho-CoA kinase
VTAKTHTRASAKLNRRKLRQKVLTDEQARKILTDTGNAVVVN